LRGHSNAAGGSVFTSDGVNTQESLVGIVEDGLKRGDDIHILTGANGSADGNMTPDDRFYVEDMERFGDLPGVVIHNLPTMSEGEVSAVLQGPGTIMGGFCHSAICLSPYR
jgi:hypothetical protein